MTRRLEGHPVVQALREDITRDVKKWCQTGIVPKMVTLLVGDDKASALYAEQKARLANRLGITFEVTRLPDDTSSAQLEAKVATLSEDPTIHGIMLELPLPSGTDKHAAIAAIHALKDVDGLSPCHSIAQDSPEAALYPATPLACIRLLKHYGYDLLGLDVSVIGCGQTVGMPLIHLLIGEGATVMACHEHTRDVAAHLKHSSVAFVAVGHPGLVKPDMVHDALTVVDVGITQGPNGILGDLDPEAASKTQAYTPTPGGVGAVTTTQIFANLMHAMDLQQKAGLITHEG